MKKIYQSSEETKAPLSGAIEVGGFIFVSGQIHMTAGKLCGEQIEEQFDVAMANVKRVLGEAGLTLDNVIRVQLYLTDLTKLPNINAIYGNYFKHPLPTRTAIGVASLPLNASLEIDVVASRE